MDASAPPDTPPAQPSVGEAAPTAVATTPVSEEAVPLVKKLWRRRGAPADEGIKSGDMKEDTVNQPPPRTTETERPEDGEAADEGAVPVKKWPALPSRKIAGESFGEMLRQHRDGEVPPTVQPLLQTTTVVKKAKPAKSAVAALYKHIRAPRLLVHVDPTAARSEEIDATTCTKAVVVVVAEGSKAAAETLSSTTTPPQSWSHTEVLRRAAGHEVPSTKDPAAPAEDKAPSVPTDVVKSGAVRKHNKQQQSQIVAAALSSSQPQRQQVSIPVTITTVKADSAVIALRALRNRGSSDSSTANDHGKPASSSKILEEISKLLRDYCSGAGAAVASTAAVASRPSLEESGTAVSSTAALDAPTSIALETPEMMLYNRLVELCQHPDVTSNTMELLHELVKHTRVIPHEPAPAAASAQNHGGEAKAAAGPNEADAQVARRRQYSQQVILVLLNQVRQRKLQEEYRASVAVRSKLSALSAPFMPAGLQTPAAAPATAPNSNTTTFAAQGTGGSHGGTERSPSLANNTASMSEPRVPAAALAHENHSGKSVTMGGGMEALFTAMRECIEASCQTPPTLPSAVRVSAEERQVLRDVQINFRQHQQQQQCLPAHLMSSTTSNTTSGDNRSGASSNVTYPLSTTTQFDPQAHSMTAPSGRYPNPQLQQRTVFSYHTVRYDPSGAESPVSQTDPPPPQPHLKSTFNHNAKPFVPTGAAAAAIPNRRAGMNAGAPAFSPALVPVAPLPPHAAAPAAAPSEPQNTTGPISRRSAAAEASPPSAPPSTATAASPWATPQMFSQWKEMMESYYHLMTMAQTFRQQQSQSQLPPQTAGRDNPP